MNARGCGAVCILVAPLLAAAFILHAPAEVEQFTLARAVPSDVFMCVVGQKNPERDFLDRYWQDVFDALKETGIDADLIALLSSVMGQDQQDEFQRLRERASQLIAGVDWEQLCGRESLFAERLAPPVRISARGIVMVPDMVCMFRGSGEGAARNYEGLAAILDAIVDEVNNAVETEALVVERSTRQGAKVAALNLLGTVPGAPSLPISVALHDDVVIIALGEGMLSDVLSLLDGSSSKKSLAETRRFTSAFAKLPPAEDEMVFFDMQALLKPIRALIDLAVGAIGGPGDAYQNTEMDPEASITHAQSITAYQQGDIKAALEFTQEAYETAPKNSIVLYNLACFNALLGNREEALGWLEKAVEGGFFAPGKIASDADLDSLRQEPRYKAARAKATQMAAECNAEDIIINSNKKGEAYTIYMQAWQAYEDDDFERGLQLMRQAYGVAPKDSRVLWGLTCFHALLGHEEKALDFLERAADGGFYCPDFIAKDPDIESLRDDQRYDAALAKARQNAAELGAKRAANEVGVWKQLVERLMNAVAILDYVAVVATTDGDGYATHAEAIAALVPGAENNPIYPVFGKKAQLTDFDRYLPQETLSFSVSGGFDLGELYNFIEESIRMAGAKGEGMLAKWDEIQASIGVDVREDVIGWIDGDSVTVTLEGDKGSVWLMKVTDEQIAREKVGKAVEFLSTKLSELSASNPGLMMLAVQASPTMHEQLEGFQELRFMMSPEPIVWGVADEHLIFGTSADAVALCLETARGAHPNIRENDRVMSEALVPSGPFTAVTLTDQRGLAQELRQGIQIASMVGGMMSMVIPDPEVRPVIAKVTGMLAKLAPVAGKIDFYKSTATLTSFDGQSWHTKSVTHYLSPEERAAATAAP